VSPGDPARPTRQGPSAPPAVIDACCLIDLLVSGQVEAILRAGGHAWHLPVAAKDEVRYLRQHDPAQPGAVLAAAADLGPYIASGLLTPCQPDDPREQAQFVHYAARFRSDGEAMCLALAESRGWPVATDDRKAIRVAGQAGLTVISCPEPVKTWAVSTKPDPAVLVQVLTDIQTLAQFRPNPTMPEATWWLQQLSTP
jgi:hypothetical protein